MEDLKEDIRAKNDEGEGENVNGDMLFLCFSSLVIGYFRLRAAR